jgi:hypothetical protein
MDRFKRKGADYSAPACWFYFYAFRMVVSATGQTAWHCGLSKCPTHSTHVAGSIKYGVPSVIELVGHSGTQAPQAMHSSVIFMAMGNYSLLEFG